MLDLHCHILPGVDDGAVDLPDTLDLARDAVSQGCRAVFTTSHLWEGLFGTSPELLRLEHENVVRAVKREGIPLEVFPGAENFLGDEAPEDFTEKAVPLGEEGRYVLVDFSLREVPPRIEDTIDALLARDLVPVFAHPERNRKLQSDPSPIGEWIARGALIQVNAASLLGYLGDGAREAGEHLLACGAAHVLASDAHDRRSRPFCLEDGRARAAALVGEEAANRMARERPWKILRGETIETPPVRIPSRSTPPRFLGKILGRRHE